mmetsp:Transcript_6851/g.15714  ORF Transcript_6851/g.15714 Transcript_6851/m.15714 type:complete len:293 (-) Transcript_6851:102-980(-)
MLTGVTRLQDGFRLFLSGFLIGIKVVQLVHVPASNLDPPRFLDVINVVDAARIRVSVRGVVDGPLSEVDGFLYGQVGPVVAVQYAIRVGGAGPHRKEVAFQARRIVVHVVKLGPRLVPTRHHGPHAQPVAAVLKHGVREKLRGRRHRDALFVPQLIETALHTEIALPKGAIGCAARHGAEEIRVDLDYLFHRLGCDVGTHCRPRVDRHNNTLIELESQCGRALGELNGLVRVCAVTSGEVGSTVGCWISYGRNGEARRVASNCSQLFRTVHIDNIPLPCVKDCFETSHIFSS